MKDTTYKKPILISFSGGRTSAYMTWLLLNERCDLIADYEPHIVFANTGCEHEKTLEFVHYCELNFGWNVLWLEAKVNQQRGIGTGYTFVDFRTASRNGEPYEQVIKKYGIPSVANPHCTRELKQAPIRAWCRDNFGKAIIDTAIGIRADEPKRINTKTAEKFKLHYPLFDLGIDKQDVINFWENQSFDLSLPEYLGNCLFCFKKSDKKLLKVLDEMPIAFDFPRRMEQYATEHRKAFFRGGRMVDDIFKLQEIVGTPLFVDDGGCSESCEFVGEL